MQKRLLLFNWKMNPQTEAEALELFADIAGAAKRARYTQVVVAPPFPFLSAIAKRWSIKGSSREEASVELAAQDLFWERAGAFTGEVSPVMEREVGVTYVLIGHSERRRFLGETSAMVAKKLARAFEYGLHPVLCVGETSRDEGDLTENLKIELVESIENVPSLFLESLIVAYEPVWAVGSGEAATAEEMHKAAIYIRKVLAETYGEGCAARARILYGGSVDTSNVGSFFTETQGEVSGVLVGGASLTPESSKLIAVVDQLGPGSPRSPADR